MLKFSRSILSLLILVAFFYKKVYSFNQLLDNDSPQIANWKINQQQQQQQQQQQPKSDVISMSVHDFLNLMDNGEGGEEDGGQLQQQQSLSQQLSSPSHGHYGHNSWFKFRPGQLRNKRQTEPEIEPTELLTNEVMPDDLMNSPLSQLDMEKVQKSPWMKYLLTRLVYYLQEKRSREFSPRLGRNADDCIEYQRSRPPFAPRLGKKAMMYFTPRLGRGRDICSR